MGITTKTITCNTSRGLRKFQIQRRISGTTEFYTVKLVLRNRRSLLCVIAVCAGSTKLSRTFDGPSLPMPSAPEAFAHIVN